MASEKSTVRLRDRIFAALGAILFLGSACAVTAYYITTTNASNNTPTSQQTCQETSVTAATVQTPTAYVPTGTVTSLQVTDVSAGTGQGAKAGDCLQVKYYGTLANGGTVFDENYDKPTALQFQLGEGEVIQGWDQGLVGLKVGGERRLVIPPALGYGNQAQGSIPANSTLVFQVKLLKIVKS